MRRGEKGILIAIGVIVVAFMGINGTNANKEFFGNFLIGIFF